MPTCYIVEPVQLATLIDRVYNPRQKSLKHPFPLDSVEATFSSLTGYTNIEKGRGTKTVRECSVFQGFCLRLSEVAGISLSMRRR